MIQRLPTYMGPHGIGTSLASAANTISSIANIAGRNSDRMGEYDDECGTDHDLVNDFVSDDDEAAQDGDHDLEKVTDFVLNIMD
jgi:hypothetical protein